MALDCVCRHTCIQQVNTPHSRGAPTVCSSAAGGGVECILDFSAQGYMFHFQFKMIQTKHWAIQTQIDHTHTPHSTAPTMADIYTLNLGPKGCML